MRYFIILLLLTVSVSAINAQDVQADNFQKKAVKQLIENGDQSIEHDLIHTYICRRCGSENQLEWAITKQKTLELIPHCGFCGKKYWPKFKPSGFLERTYSLGKVHVHKSS